MIHQFWELVELRENYHHAIGYTEKKHFTRSILALIGPPRDLAHHETPHTSYTPRRYLEVQLPLEGPTAVSMEVDLAAPGGPAGPGAGGPHRRLDVWPPLEVPPPPPPWKS